MKRLLLFFAAGTLVTLCSCKEEVPEKPKVIYEDTSKTRQIVQTDTARIEIADLPIHIPGTDYLIHPIGDFRSNDGRSRAYGYDKGGFIISNFSEYEITGFLHNLLFQEMSSDSLQPLTDKRVLIQTATFLKLVAEQSKLQIMVYTMADSDTNKDGRLDVNDIRALYIGQLGGEEPAKISPDLQELVDWYVVEGKNRLYFRTIEDTNKNGEFDRNDVLHYFYLDLSNGSWQAVEYHPV